MTENDRAYIKNEVAQEREDTKTWEGIKALIVVFLVISYGVGLFSHWEQTLHLTRLFWKLFLLNAVFCIPVLVLLSIPVKPLHTGYMVKTLVVCVLCILMPMFAVLAAKTALFSEVHFHHRTTSTFTVFVWWVSVFMVARSPFVLHRLPKIGFGAKEIFSIMSTQRAARIFCFWVFIACFFSSTMTHKLKALSWVGQITDWIAK